MPASFDLELRFPLPAILSPQLVIQNLHSYEPLIRPNPYLQGFQRIPVDLDDVVADPFFTEDGTDIAAYEVHDRIPVVFGLTKDVKFPAIFQAITTGVRVKADAAAGTLVRSTYEVCPHRYEQHQENEGEDYQQGDIDEFLGHPSHGNGGGNSNGQQLQQQQVQQQTQQWELVERSHVECSAVLKPFIMKSFEAAHRDLCQKVLDNIVKAATAEQDTMPLGYR